MSDKRFNTAKRQFGPQVRTFDMVQNISGPVEGEINDWPAHMQDTIYFALEQIKKKHNLPGLLIVHSVCDHDIDHGWYVHVIAQHVSNLLVLQ